MKTLKHIILLVLFTPLLLVSCSVTPEPIHYGEDGCHFCKMTIVDKEHAAQIVTNTGKVYKFDATECMVRFKDEFDNSKIQMYLSNDYAQPGTLIDATQATFLISKNVPSPMGAFLSAFEAEADAEALRKEKGGTLYTWETLQNTFNP